MLNINYIINNYMSTKFFIFIIINLYNNIIFFYISEIFFKSNKFIRNNKFFQDNK